MKRTRFAPWLVFACIGTLVGCDSGDQGTAGNTELNVVIPSGSSQSGPGTPQSFDIESVEYTINCTGPDFDPTSDPDIDSGDTLDQDVQINGSLEVLDTASAGVTTQNFGPDLDDVYVWQGYMDIPADHDCTVQLRARDAGGEVICTATEPFSVGADAVPTVKVNVLMICDISYQAPVGMLDLDGDFSFNIGNYCPDLFVLNCVDPDLENLLTVPGLGSFVYSGCQVRFRDADSTCGDNCDPQTCVTTPAGLDCAPAAEQAFCSGGNNPGAPCALARCTGGDNDGAACTDDLQCQGTSPVADGSCDPTTNADECQGISPTPDGTCDVGPQTVVTCDNPGFFCAIPGALFRTPCTPAPGDTCFDLSGGTACAPAALQNCGGATANPSCTFNGDTLGTVGAGPPRPLNVGPGGFLVGCTMVDDDGDDETPLVALAPGATVTCTAVTTDGDEDCDKTKTVEVSCPGDTQCTVFGGNAACQAASDTLCQVGTCDNSTCDGSTAAACCVYTDAPDGATCTDAAPPAQCIGGVCVSSDCNDPSAPPCDDGNECTADSCNADGSCEFTPTPGDDCTGGTGVCQADGSCLNKCDPSLINCDDDNQCTDDGCDVISGVATCSNTNNDSNSCDSCGATNCTCDGGSCIAGLACPPAPVGPQIIRNACRNSFNQAVSTFPITMTATPLDCPVAGAPFDTIIDPVIALDLAFLQAAADTLCTLGTALQTADVSIAQVQIDAIAGASCTPALSELPPPLPQTVVLDVTVTGTCGAGGQVTVNTPTSLTLPQVTVSCTTDAATGGDVTFCSTGETPLGNPVSEAAAALPPNLTLTDPVVGTWLGVNVPAGVTPPPIQVVFSCDSPATVAPTPGTEVGCVFANTTGGSTPTGETCAEAVGAGNFGQTQTGLSWTDAAGFPVSDCNTEGGEPDPPQTCLLFGVNSVPCSGTCGAVPIALEDFECIQFAIESCGSNADCGTGQTCDTITGVCSTP